MQVSQRNIGAFAPVTPVNCIAPITAQQSSPPSEWQLRKKAEQILEVKQQIETTNTNDKHRIKSLKRKLKQLERQQALNKAKSTPDPETPALYPPSTASPVSRTSSTLDPTARDWTPPTLPIADPRAVRFEVPNHFEHRDSRWGAGGLNPYTHRLLGSELLAAIYGLRDSSPAVDEVVPVDDSFPAVKHTVAVDYDDDDGDSIFFFASNSPPPSFVDSGYGSST